MPQPILPRGPSARRVWPDARRARLVLGACVVVAVGVAAAFYFSVSAHERCAEAAWLGEWRKAREACASSIDQGNDDDLVLLAKAEMNLGNDAVATRLAEQASVGPNHADALALTGVLQDRAGDAEGARETLHQAIALFLSRGDAREVSRAYFALAGSYWRQRRLHRTLEALDASNVAAHAANDGRMKGYVALMRGDVLRAVGDARSAERQYDLAAASLAERRADMAYVHLKEGILRQEAGLLHLARLSFEHALADARETGREDAVTAVRQNLAFNAHLEGDSATGLSLLARWPVAPDASYYTVRAVLEADGGMYVEALASLDEASRLSRSDDDWYAEFERGRILEKLGDDVGAESAYVRSIAVVEQMRDAMELGELQAWMIPRRRGPYEALLALHVRRGEPERALRVLEAFSARSFMDAIIANTGSVHTGADVSSATRAFQRIGELGGEPGAIGALEGHEILIPVEVLGRLYVAHKPPHGDPVFFDRGDARHVEDLVSRFVANPDDTALADELGAILLPDEIEPGDTILHVVPTGWLAGLPFAALRRNGHFLVEERPLAETPSLRAFSLRGGARIARGVLVVGDADGTLPAARSEAFNIGELLGVKPFVAADATRARLQNAGSLELLHLGTHAGLGGGAAWLKLADGRWSVDEVLDSETRADVVVLATCSSATTHRGELWGSIAIAFLANGSRSVVATLGSVDDRDTSELIGALYRAGLREDPVRALASAQRTLSKTRPPRAWAPFVVYTAGHD